MRNGANNRDAVTSGYIPTSGDPVSGETVGDGCCGCLRYCPALERAKVHAFPLGVGVTAPQVEVIEDGEHLEARATHPHRSTLSTAGDVLMTVHCGRLQGGRGMESVCYTDARAVGFVLTRRATVWR
jgi:hypothetical protein